MLQNYSMETQPSPPQPPGNVVLVKRRADYTKKACNFCKKRKKKCDQGRPCLFCVRHGEHCSHLDLSADADQSSKRPEKVTARVRKKSTTSSSLPDRSASSEPSTSASSVQSPLTKPWPGFSNGTPPDSLRIHAGITSMNAGSTARKHIPQITRKLSTTELVEVQGVLSGNSMFSAFENSTFPSVDASLPKTGNLNSFLDRFDPTYMKYFHDIHHTANPVLHIETFIKNFDAEPKILKISVMALGKFDYLREMNSEHSIEQCIEGLDYTSLVDEAFQITRDPPNCHALYGAILLATFLTRICKDSMDLRRQISSAIIIHEDYFNPRDILHMQEITNSPYFIDQEERIRLVWVMKRQSLYLRLILGKSDVMKNVEASRPPLPFAIWSAIPVPAQFFKGNSTGNQSFSYSPFNTACCADWSWPSDSLTCVNLPRKDLSPLDLSIIRCSPANDVVSLHRFAYQKSCFDLLQILIKSDNPSFDRELQQWYEMFPEEYKSTTICIADPSQISFSGWQFYNLVSLYHVVQIWKHRNSILKHLNEHGCFDLEVAHFQSSVSSANQIMNYLSGSLISNRRFAGMKSFAVSSAYYAAIMFIAVAMAAEADLVELSVAVYNVEKCLSCLMLIERTLPMIQGNFSSPLRRLLSLVMAKHRGMLDIAAFFDFDAAVSGMSGSLQHMLE